MTTTEYQSQSVAKPLTFEATCEMLERMAGSGLHRERVGGMELVTGRIGDHEPITLCIDGATGQGVRVC